MSKDWSMVRKGAKRIKTIVKKIFDLAGENDQHMALIMLLNLEKKNHNNLKYLIKLTP